MKIYHALLAGCALMCNLGAETLLENGSFEAWDGNAPAGWEAANVLRGDGQGESGTAAVTLRPTDGKSATLRSKPLKLVPGAEYLLSFHYRAAAGGGMRVTVAGSPQAALSLGVPYTHRGGVRIEHFFRAGESAGAEPRVEMEVKGQALVMVDNVYLVPAERAWNRGVFRRLSGAEAECVFTAGNVESSTRRCHVEMELFDYYNKRLWSDAKDVELKGGASESWTTKFTVGGSPRHRAVMKVSMDNGHSDEAWTYLNSDVVDGMRKTYELSGMKWRHQRVKAGQPLRDDGWEEVALPHVTPNTRQSVPDECLYRLTEKIPAVGADNKLFLVVDNGGLSPEVFVNGKRAGGCVGRSPLEVELTGLWRDGRENEITIRCLTIEAATVAKGGGGTLSKLPYAVAAGLGGARLETRPVWRTERLKIETSAKTSSVSVAGVVRNDSLIPGWFTVETTALDGDKPVLTLPPKKFYLVPFEPVVFKTCSDWDKPHLYFPHDPFLYNVETVVKDGSGKILDRQRSRFGFREVAVDGKHVLYNGRKAKFITRLSAPHPRHVYNSMGSSLDESMARHYRSLQMYARLGMVYGREYVGMQHLPPWRLDIMDEMGFSVRESFELNMAYCSNDDSYEDTPAYWDAMRRQTENSMRSTWNHPSVIAWDMENETFLCSTQHTFPELFDQYQRLRDIVRGNDRSRPLLHDSADPMGDGDIISLHYPIDVTRQFPPSPVFPLVPFEKGKLYSQLNLHPGAYVWNEDRPLVLGEDLIDLHEFPQSLSLYADEAVYGQYGRDKAFSPELFVNCMARMNEILQYLGREYRKREVHVLTTWSCCHETHSDELARDAVVVDQYHGNFHSAEKVERSLTWFHDPMNDLSAVVAWRLVDASGKVHSKADVKADVKGGDLFSRRFTVDCPVVEAVTPLRLELAVSDVATGKELCRRSQPWRVFPKTGVVQPAGLSVALFDPKGETAQTFAAAGLKFDRVATPNPAGHGLLVVGKNALVEGGELPTSLDAHVRGGGKVLVMEQEGRVGESLPYAPSANVGMHWPVDFVRIPEHPVAKGLVAEDLRFWRGDDQMVSSANWHKPWRGNILPILDGGSMGGFLNSPLLEIPWGKGWYLLCQLKISSKLEAEPAAAKLLTNILAYAAAAPYRSCDKPLHCLGSESLRRAAESCGAKVTAYDGSKELPSGATLLVDAGAEIAPGRVAALRAAVESGAVLWLQGLAADNAGRWAALVGEARFETYSSANLIKVADSPLTPGLTNTDLFWIGVPEWDFYGKTFDQVDVGKIVDNPPLPLANAEQLIIHGALQWLPLGKGGVLVDSVRWPGNLDAIPQRAPRLPCSIMTGLGVALKPRPGDMGMPSGGAFAPVNLRAQFNLPLNGMLPTGEKRLADIPFDIVGKGKGAVMLGSERLTTPTPWLKTKVDGIAINRKADRVYLLLTCFNSYESGRGFGAGETIGGLLLHYADGTSQTFPIQQKVDCANLFETFGDLKRGKVGWEGLNPFALILSKLTIWQDDEWIQTSGLNRLYVTHFDNPRPDVPIVSASLKSANQHFAPIIFGMTLYQAPRQGK